MVVAFLCHSTANGIAEFAKLNPSEQIPTLSVNGKAISQSVAIMEYLEEQYPGNGIINYF